MRSGRGARRPRTHLCSLRNVLPLLASLNIRWILRTWMYSALQSPGNGASGLTTAQAFRGSSSSRVGQPHPLLNRHSPADVQKEPFYKIFTHHRGAMDHSGPPRDMSDLRETSQRSGKTTLAVTAQLIRLVTFWPQASPSTGEPETRAGGESPILPVPASESAGGLSFSLRSYALQTPQHKC
mgnify:FL=1